MPSNSPPKRIQRKRSAGWKMPPNTKCVTRGTKFGNPFPVPPHPPERKGEAHLVTVNLFEAAVRFHDHFGLPSAIGLPTIAEIKTLRGFNLACYCRPGLPCHADVLLRIANQ